MAYQLLCTFTNTIDCDVDIDNIILTYSLPAKKILMFSSVNENDVVYLSYNISDVDIKIKNTIPIHRKPSTNTMYTINAMNQLICSMNNGYLDHTYIVPWENYRNCLLLHRDMSLEKIPLKFLRMVNL